MVDNNIYQCGDRTCTDADLDQIERLKSGAQIVADPAGPEGVIGGLSKKVDDLCAQFPELCRKVDSVAGELHGHPEPNDSLIAHLESCPTCKSKLETEFIPKLAAKYGYNKPVVEPSAEADQAVAEAAAEATRAAAEAAETETEKGDTGSALPCFTHDKA